MTHQKTKVAPLLKSAKTKGTALKSQKYYTMPPINHQDSNGSSAISLTLIINHNGHLTKTIRPHGTVGSVNESAGMLYRGKSGFMDLSFHIDFVGVSNG